MELVQLMFEREVSLNSIQRMADCIDNEAEFRVRSRDLNTIKKQFHAVQGKIEKHLAKKGEFNQEDQLAIRDKFDNLYYVVQIALDNLKVNIRKNSMANVTSPLCHSHPSKIKLPTISLPTFSGDVTQWIAFFDLFKSLVHDNEDLSDVQRFRYLLLSLRDEPLNLIKSIPVTDSNYTNALQILITRYENKRIIATKHFDKIFDAPPVNDKNVQQSLKNILNVCHENLTALKSLDFPVLDWSFPLLNILLRKITPSIRRRFELSLKSSSEIPPASDLLDFLDKELSALEVMSAAKDSAPVATASSSSRQPTTSARPAFSRALPDTKNNYNANTARPTRSVTFHSSSDNTKRTCCYCNDETHKLSQCDSFNKLDLKERLQFIKENKICVNCLLKGHESGTCFSRYSCRICSQRHHTTVHENNNNATHDLLTEVPQYPENSLNYSTVLLTTALININQVNSNSQYPNIVRALVDQGSQATLITESCAQRLGLKRFRTSSSATVTGIGDKDNQPRGYVTCEITPYNRSEPKLFIEALVLPKITSYIPTIPKSFETIRHLQDLPLADPDLRSPRPIELLLGSDYTDRILLHNIIKGPQGTPVAINSIFGYLLNGKIAPATQICVNVSTYQLDMQLQKFWELESVPETKPLTKEEILCESIFVNTHSRDSTGKYIVSLPFKENAPPLGDSREIALSRLHRLESKLSSNSVLRAEYVQCLQEYVDLGHMELIQNPSSTSAKAYYIPHHAVVKKSSATTKVRVVFDASCKTTSGRSLNDNLLIGQKLQQDIIEVLLKYRLHNVVFTSDIKMMYRYIQIRNEDRDFQRILWRNSTNDPIQEYRLCTVTFGVASAPFLALRTLRQLAIDEASSFPLASQVLLNDVFVDDVVTGAATLDDALMIQRELTALCKAGTFELRKWTSNSSQFLSTISKDNRNNDNALILSGLDDDTSVKILGLQWNPRTDTFSYHVDEPSHKCTKRIMLSEISKIYDPLGFLSPIILLVKHLIQLLWISGVGWDEQPPKTICELWATFISEFNLLENVSLPRHILRPSYKEIQIHGFSDSSEKAYAGCVYLRVIDHTDNIHTFLIIAKTKVSPLKRVTLPRLELCGAVLVSKLIEKVLITYGNILPFENVFAWSDSSITLAWLRAPSHEWRTYVANRVTEITSRVPASQWRHVRSADNPADVASRGVMPSQLNHELWFTGPPWLKLPQQDWPTSNVDLQTDEERRKHILVSQNEPQDLQFLERFSSLSVVLRVVSLCFRFYHKCRKTKSYSSNQITVLETKFALQRLLTLVQKDQFSIDILHVKNNENCSNQLQKLKPFLDTTGLLRVGGRIQNANIPYDAKHQIILPKNHVFTNLLIDHFHKIHLHVGPQTLQFLISQTYWILSARDAIRMRTRRCVRCFRARPTAPQPIMAQLPAARVRSLRPFLHVAVDFAGPFLLKSSPLRRAKVYKSYVSVFVCMSTKAVHLELVPDLSTDSFLNALRRLVSRRGLCTDIYSDCGRNFIGSERYLKELFQFLQEQSNQDVIQNNLTELSITWHFNPPYASHFGGIFEAAVKSMKSHLYRVIGKLTLTHDEFNTLLCQIEAVLNSRPLGTLSNDPTDPLPLTPGHFLIGEPLTSLPEYDFTNDNPNRLRRLEVIQQAVQHFWKRWSVEYLHQLQPRGKWVLDKSRTPLREGSIVVLIDNTLPPLQWRLARVHQLHPGVDGVTRVVTVRIGYTKPFVKCGKKGYVMPGAFRKHAEAIYNMQVRSDDVWVITFPRSGTTWTQEMVWLIENDLDFKAAQKLPLFDRFPMLETTSQIPEVAFELIKANFMNLGYFQGLNNAVKTPSWKTIDEAPSPRFIKTHLPISLLPPSLLSTAKVIYVARDPRDVAVSYYYLHKMVSKTLMRATFTHFWHAFRRDLLPWTPIIEHTNEAWELRHKKNMHFLFYEDMIKDLPKVIRGVCKFLDRVYSDEQVTQLADHLSFKSLRKNKTVNNTTNENGDIQFIRKGEAGGWRTHFDAEMEVQAEEFLSTKLKGLTLKYPSLCDMDGECTYL